MRYLIISIMTLCLGLMLQPAMAAPSSYQLGAGDVLKISVHNNPDLSLDTRVSEAGVISFPLVGEVPVGGLTTSAAEKKIATMLANGGFIMQPQVNILVTQFQSAMVSVLGGVNKPGRYALERSTSLTELLAIAGGIAANGADTIVLNTVRDGAPAHIEVDIDKSLRKGTDEANVVLLSGDVIYVSRVPLIYIYGEVQRPGTFRMERDMTVIQALAQGGGPTIRGTQRGIKLHRRNLNGDVMEFNPELTEKVQPDDVLYVKESLF